MPQALIGVIAAIGVPGLTTATGALTTLGSLAAGALGLGLSYGLNALLGRPEGPKPADVKGIVRQSLPTRKKYRGRVRTGGAMFFIQTENGRLHQGIYFGEGPCDGIEEWITDERSVTLDANGQINEAPYDDRVNVQSRLGAVPSVHYEGLATTFPTIWSSAHRGDGWISCYVVQSGVKPEKFNEIYPNRYIQVNTIRRDGKAYDPRTGTTAWTANLPLILRDFLVDPDGSQIDAAYLDDADFSAGAAYADQLIVTSGGGTVRRYHGQLAYDMASEPGEAIQRALTAMDGRLFLKANGKIGFLPGRWIEPTVRLPDAAIIAYELSDGGGPLREANEAKVSYTNPLTRYSEAECDPWRDEDDISLSGQVKSVSIAAYEIQNHHHARRIAKLRVRRASAEWMGTITYDLRGMEAWDQRFARVELLDLGIDYLPFEIMDAQLADDGLSVTYQVISTGPDNWELSFAEEGTPPRDPESLEEDQFVPPQNLQVVGLSRNVSGGQKIAVLRATWSAAAGRDDLTAQAQYSPADQEKWLEMAVADSDVLAEAVGLADGDPYDARVRWVGAGGTVSSWVMVENIVVEADKVAPGSPLSFSAVSSGGVVSVSAKAANDNTRYLVFKRGTSGQSFAQATLLGRYSVTANQTIAIADTPAAGIYKYWCGAENGSGKPSAAQPSATIATSDSRGPELITTSPGLTDGWTLSGNQLSHAAGSSTEAYWSVALTAGESYELKFTVLSISGGGITPRLFGGTTVTGAVITGAGSKQMILTAASGNAYLTLLADAATAATIDKASVSLKRIA